MFPIDIPDVIVELDEYPCASDVLNRFVNFNSVISNLIRDVFDFDVTMNIIFEVDQSLAGTGTDANFSQDCDFEFVIRMNPEVLKNSTPSAKGTSCNY